MRWDPRKAPDLQGSSRPLTEMDKFIDALAGQVEELEARAAAQADDIAKLKAKAGL